MHKMCNKTSQEIDKKKYFKIRGSVGLKKMFQIFETSLFWSKVMILTKFNLNHVFFIVIVKIFIFAVPWRIPQVRSLKNWNIVRKGIRLSGGGGGVTGSYVYD